MTTFNTGPLFDQTKEIYEIVGKNTFTIFDLPKEIPKDRNRKTLTRLENRNYLIRITHTTTPTYKINPRVIDRINAETILNDPEIIEALKNKTITYTSISLTTGYSINTIKIRITKKP